MNKINGLPRSLALFSEKGEHAGFVLFAPGGDDLSGECVFILSPISAEGIDSKMSLVVSELKVTGEHAYRILANEAGIDVIIEPESLPNVLIRFKEESSANVITEFNGENISIGSAEKVQKNA